ncbi:MAG: CPBP family intramembrane metalloprotease, partial [Alphaproteobacteria bacterium]|nr:CPBP family intramembrane metalloprotease [Alphaproteobacteria bacterium]
SFWPAAILLSAIFGAAHLMNGGENHVGALVAFLFGIVLAFSFRQTGSLWLALGLHSGWDYAESFIFGVPDSGVVLSGRLFHSVLHGPDWLTGGTVGPEGSILVAAPLLAMVLVSWLLRARQDVAPN